MSVPAAANPVHAHVAFLRIPQFEARSPAEQAAAKERLEARLLEALASIAPPDRVVLDAEDGFALVLFGDAERAYDVGQRLHAAAGGGLQVGLNHGPLALTERGAEARVFGDGLAAAAAAARFATPEQLLVTEHFARALREVAPDRAGELAHAGEFTDTHVRQHAFLTPDPARRAVRRRRLAVYAAGGAVVILLLGVLGRDIYQPLFQSRPGIVKLEIRPRGEVFVDGVSRGRVPPLTEIEVPPGTRRIEVRQPGYRTLDRTIDVKPGQRLTLTHTMARVPQPKPKSGFWEDLKRSFGGS